MFAKGNFPLFFKKVGEMGAGKFCSKLGGINGGLVKYLGDRGFVHHCLITGQFI